MGTDTPGGRWVSVVVDAIELDELVLDELSVTSIRDAVALPDTAQAPQSAASCCLSYECCCSCYYPEDPV
jgi:hypothetical protein